MLFEKSAGTPFAAPLGTDDSLSSLSTSREAVQENSPAPDGARLSISAEPLRVLVSPPDDDGVHSARCLEYFLTAYGPSVPDAVERLTRMISRQEEAWNRYSWSDSQQHRDYLVGEISPADLSRYDHSPSAGQGGQIDFRAPHSGKGIEVRSSEVSRD